MKVGDLIQSSAFEGQHGIVIETDYENDAIGSWYHVVWLKVSRHYYLIWNKDDGIQYEWCREHEIEPRDIS